MASEEPKQKLNEGLNKETIPTANTATLSSMSSTAQIAPTNNQLPLKQFSGETLQGRENKDTWWKALTLSAKKLGYWTIIIGKEVKPKESDTVQFQTWKLIDLHAIDLILGSISHEMRVKFGHKSFNATTTTSRDLLGQIVCSMLTEAELERLKSREAFLRRFNRTEGHSFASTEAFIAQLMEEWTKMKAKYPDAPDEWLNMAATTGLESLKETDDEPPLF